MSRWIWTCLALLAIVSIARSDEIPQKFSGDGLTIVVKTVDDDTGKVTGELVKGDKSFPFTGLIQEEISGEAITGSFVGGGETFKFTSRVDPKTGDIFFATGSKTYRLRPELRELKVDANNPLNPDANDDPLIKDPDIKKPENPLHNGADVDQPKPVVNKPAAADEVLRLKRVKFNDISMGGLPSHTMLIPEDWKASGNVYWAPAENPFPQNNIRVEGPDGTAIVFVPSANLGYLETRPIPGMLQMPPQGIKPPEKLGEFIVQVVAKEGKVSNVRLVEDRRDAVTEAGLEAQARQTGMAGGDMRNSIHHVTFTYDKNGVPFRECGSFLYVRYPDTINENIHSQMWSLFTLVSIAAPADKFEAKIGMLYKIAGTYRPIPNWWVQYFEVRQQIINQRHRDAMAAIKARGEFYNSMSDTQYQNYKTNMAASDKAQKDRLDAIYERQDYRDVDGSNVNFTFHYNHIYSNGEGGYVLTNNPLHKPTDGNFREIDPARRPV